MMFNFEIPGPLPGMNDIISASRTHWNKSRQQKKTFTNMCGMSVIAARVPVFKDPVHVEFAWYEKNQKRDRDNVSAGAKFILDALVETGRLKNDTAHWVRGISHTFPAPDSKNPRVMVTIYDA